ncbi:hypothetical protein C5167_039096, partial [Papaver somniferum]
TLRAFWDASYPGKELHGMVFQQTVIGCHEAGQPERY